MHLSLTRSVTFAARHRLAFADRSAEENRAEFGILSEAHQHQYTCRVTVAASPMPRTGMVMDLLLLDRILADEVTGPLDGSDLNATLNAVRSGAALPVCEVLARELFGRIASRLPAGVTLESVRIEEDPDLYAECRRG